MNKNCLTFELLSNELWPLHRTVVSKAFDASLDLIGSYWNNGWDSIYEVPSGTELGAGWRVPNGWYCKKKKLITIDGKNIINLDDSNLRVPSHSQGIPHRYISKEELLPHLYTSNNFHDAIPYLTSYYSDSFWGLCITKDELEMIEDSFDGGFIEIDNKFHSHSLKIAERHLGNKENYIVVNTYLCHPSMANNELSGPLVMAEIIKTLEESGVVFLECGVKFLIWPETIGPIAYQYLFPIKEFGTRPRLFLTLTCLGLANSNYSILGGLSNAWNKQVIASLEDTCIKERPWSERGSDERQLNWPQSATYSATITKGAFGAYSEYHTSRDNFDLVALDDLKKVAGKMVVAIKNLTSIDRPFYKFSHEPFLSAHGMYPEISRGSHNSIGKDLCALLILCDGVRSVNQISEILPEFNIEYIELLIQHGKKIGYLN
jgi:aminopeptidase-like protein